jgi:exonuclease VII small subunit
MLRPLIHQMSMSDTIHLSDNLKQLKEIAEWFDTQDTVDVEKGLEKIKKAAQLIKESRKRLTAVQNEFTEIQKELEEEEKDFF